VDPNLQVRIETALPPPDIRPRLPKVEDVPVARTETFTTTETVPLTLEQRRQRLQKMLIEQRKALPMETLTTERLDELGVPKTEKRSVKRTRTRTEIVRKVEERKTQVSAITQSQSAFDSNALKSNLTRASDWIFTNSGTLNINIPIGAFDSIVLQSGVADQSYAKLASKDLELVSNSATYVQVLRAVPGPQRLSSPGTTTVDALSYGMTSTTVFGSGFRPYQVELFTPSVVWGRSNADLGRGVCGARGQEAYCLSGDASVEGDYTFSDITTQENFTAKLQGSIVSQSSIAGLTFSATGSLQGKYFTAFPGGRQDLILQGTARADYAVNTSLVISGVLQVSRKRSAGALLRLA